jgi:hypothetical protein
MSAPARTRNERSEAAVGTSTSDSTGAKSLTAGVFQAIRKPQTGVPELVLRSTGSRVRLPVSTTRLMLVVAMRRLPSGFGTGRVLVLADEPSPAAQRAGRRNRAAGEGTPSGWQPARERPCLRRPAQTSARLHAPSERLTRSSATPHHRALTGTVLLRDGSARTSLWPDHAAPGTPGARSRVRDVI